MNHRVKKNTLLADKLLVKDYVKELIGEEYIIPTLKTFDNSNDIILKKLPNKFVIKLNHGSGWNIICRNKENLDFATMITKLNRWKKINYYDIGKEYQYKHIAPKIFCEEYIENSISTPLIDYKIFCFDGRPKFIQVDLDRFSGHRRNFFDIHWNLLPFTTLYPMGDGTTTKPKQLKKMLDIAEVLSKDQPFSRIDLYNFKGKILFGEITFHHGGGFEPFIPRQYDSILGAELNLKKNRIKIEK